MRLMWKYVRKYWMFLILLVISCFGFVLIEVGLPTMLADAMNVGFNENNIDYVYQKAMQMFAAAVVGMIGVIILNYCTQRISSAVIRDIRHDIYQKAQEISHVEYDTVGISQMITNTINDPYQVMLFLNMALKMVALTPIMFISSIVMMFIYGGNIAYSIAVALPLLLIGIIYIAIKSKKLSALQQTNLDSINLNMRESLTGLRVIRAFRNEDFQETRFDTVNQTYTATARKLFQLMALGIPSFVLVFLLLECTVLWLGAHQVANHLISFATLGAFIEYVFHTLFSFMMFALMFMMYPRAAVSAKRIEKILALIPFINENPDGVKETETQGYVEFKNVSFAYPDSEEAILKNVNFSAAPGEIVAFIGSTGSGKSTLIQLLPRFFDVSSGSILIDGIDTRDYNLEALRDKIAYIPQKAILFSGTIAENIQYGKTDATMDEIKEAARIAEAAPFIEEKSLQYEDPVSEGGINMSGGQKQRLSIARAIIKNAPIIVFDDSFSALDYATDAKLRKNLKPIIKHSTVFIVAQRVGTIMDADKIIVLNEGEVVAIGTHKELLRTSDIYYEIASSQLSKEELEC